MYSTPVTKARRPNRRYTCTHFYRSLVTEETIVLCDKAENLVFKLILAETFWHTKINCTVSRDDSAADLQLCLGYGHKCLTPLIPSTRISS